MWTFEVIRALSSVLAGFIVFGGFSAQALDDVECWEAKCLKFGWTLKGIDRVGFTDHQCRDPDCGAMGWIMGGTLGVDHYTSCREGGCFRGGWYEIHRRTQQMVRQVICEQGDCWRYGWRGYQTEGASITRCLEGNCQSKGWQTIFPGHKVETCYCKNGDCFRYGWIVTTQ